MEVVRGRDDDREERLNAMMTAYEKDLLRLCCVFLRDYELAKDAAQETFLRAYKAMDAFRGDCAEKTWLIKIAANVCRDMRRSAWHRFVDRRVTLEHLPAPVTPPSDEHIALTEAIMRLPRKSLEVVTLYYYQNMKVKEIAQALSLSLGTVSGRLQKARKQLHIDMEGGQDDA